VALENVPQTPLKLLFVCSRNRLRSPTAEAVFSTYPSVEASSAGTNPDADNPLSADLIEWADVIFLMEQIHRKRLNQRFPSLLKDKKVVVLGIPDDYCYMDEKLIVLLKSKVLRHIGQ
jgi:predicted protein tyrosine phosphatase